MAMSSIIITGTSTNASIVAQGLIYCRHRTPERRRFLESLREYFYDPRAQCWWPRWRVVYRGYWLALVRLVPFLSFFFSRRPSRVFFLQAPLLGLASILVTIFLGGIQQQKTSQSGKNTPSIRRVDFLGTVVLAVSIVAIILLLDRGGQAFPWLSPYALGLSLTGILSLALFVYVEKYMAAEPIFDLRIFRNPNIVPSFLIGGLQTSAQVSMMFTVALYFQVVMGTTSTVAGVHLVPAVLGNTIGGVLAGFFIRRTGRYKPVLILAGIIASISYVLQFFLWNGHTGFWGSFYITPGGMGTAFAAAAAFVSMTSFLQPTEIAMATGGYILFSTFSVTAGVTATNTVLGITFKKEMQRGLRGQPDMEKVSTFQ